VISIDRELDGRQLLWFEALVQLALLAMALCGLLRRWGHATIAVLAGTAALLFVLFRLVPRSRGLLHRGWVRATLPVGLALSHVLFLALYFMVLTPTGLLRRVAGRQAVARGFDRKEKSYWQVIEHDDSVERYFRQF